MSISESQRDEQRVETIKSMVVQTDPERFFLVDSLLPEATYKVLWYNLDLNVQKPQQPKRVMRRRVCKIDILTPQTFGFPPIAIDELPVSSQSISYIPILHSLLLKLAAWRDHSSIEAKDNLKAKIPTDEQDIDVLLRGCMSRKIGANSGQRQEVWRLGGFRSAKESEKCVRRYVNMVPETLALWRAVGFL